MERLFGNLYAALIALSFVIVALVLIALWRKSLDPIKAMILVGGAFLFDIMVLSIPIAASLPYPYWIGKTVSFLWPLLLLPWISSKDLGLKAPNLRGILLGVLFGFAFTFYATISAYFTADFSPDIDMLLFVLIMPGLSEEMVYRGLLLVPLKKVRKLASFDLGIMIISLLFILMHLITYSTLQHQIEWNFSRLGELIAFTAALGFLRLKTDSIWPSVICHNLINSGPVFAMLIKSGL